MSAHELATTHHTGLVEFGLWMLWKAVALVLALAIDLCRLARWWWPQPTGILPGAQLDETRWPVFTGQLGEET